MYAHKLSLTALSLGAALLFGTPANSGTQVTETGASQTDCMIQSKQLESVICSKRANSST